MCPCHAVAGYLSFDSSSHIPPDRQGLGFAKFPPIGVKNLFAPSFLERTVERVVEDVAK
jgi:hypothetical protein